MELSCFWCSLHEADKDVVEGWQQFIKGTDVQVLADEILYHIIVTETIIDPDAQFVVVALLHIK